MSLGTLVIRFPEVVEMYSTPKVCALTKPSTFSLWRTRFASFGMCRCVCINPDCSHQFVEEPDTSESAHATNEAKWLLHKENVEGFVEAHTLGVPYISTTAGKRITSVPRDKHKYNNLYLQCHCLKFSCITQDKHVPEYLCPIKCLDHNGDRFPCDEDGVCQ